MSSWLSRGLRKLKSNVKKHGGKLLGLGLGLAGMGGLLGKVLGGGSAAGGGWYPGKYLGQMFGGGQGGSQIGPVMESGQFNPLDYDKGGGGKGMGFFGDLAGKFGGMFGLEDGAAKGGGMGGLLSMLGTGGMAQGGNYSADMMRNLQNQTFHQIYLLNLQKIPYLFLPHLYHNLKG
jgi:hypothetical protein